MVVRVITMAVSNAGFRVCVVATGLPDSRSSANSG